MIGCDGRAADRYGKLAVERPSPTPARQCSRLCTPQSKEIARTRPNAGDIQSRYRERGPDVQKTILQPVLHAAARTGGLRLSRRRRPPDKGRGRMEALGSMEAVCVDKTGTLIEDVAVLEYFVDSAAAESKEVTNLVLLERDLGVVAEGVFDVNVFGVLEGTGSATIDGEDIELAAGDWLRIPPLRTASSAPRPTRASHTSASRSSRDPSTPSRPTTPSCASSQSVRKGPTKPRPLAPYANLLAQNYLTSRPTSRKRGGGASSVPRPKAETVTKNHFELRALSFHFAPKSTTGHENHNGRTPLACLLRNRHRAAPAHGRTQALASNRAGG